MPWQPLNNESTGIVAIHAALLSTHPDGEVLCFGDWAGSGGGGVLQTTLSRVFHVSDGTNTEFLEENLPTTNGFCGGHAWLPDGRLLLGGGTIGWPEAHAGPHDEHYAGERACYVYLPGEMRWERIRDLNFQPGNDPIGGGRWYPTLVTLGNGEIIAIGGHPDDSDTFEGRHNNTTPERYAAAADAWTTLTAGRTAPTARNTDSYPRYHLLPNGLLFCDTSGDGGNQDTLDPATGGWVGDPVDRSLLTNGGAGNGNGYFEAGSAATSVLLPLLPPTYTPRVVAFNAPAATAFRIDPNDTDPAWKKTANRVGGAAGTDRENGCATLLPTGQVILTGGWRRDTESDPATAITQAELYDPGIDWGAGDFSGSEKFIDLPGEIAAVGRGYHSTALLLPDGRVWTGGSTMGGGQTGAETRVEYYAPAYVGQSRPSLSAPPRTLRYGQSFKVETNRAIERVALIRCSSVTHGFDSDQRYVGCEFTQDEDTLTIVAPPNGNVAPPGPYMLWVIDGDDRPCERAQFVRLAATHLQLYTDRSTISVHELTAIPARFNYAFYVVLDGAVPGDVGNADPVITFLAENGAEVTDMDWELAGKGWENPSAPPDVAQRLTCSYHIRFDSDAAFDAITGGSDTISLRAEFLGLAASASIVLSENANPWMKDGSTPWLSTDVRVFQIQPGDVLAGIVHGSGSGAPEAFITALVNKFEQLEPEIESHPFNVELETEQDQSPLTFASEGANGQPVYNYAVAKVRLTAPVDVNADDVGVFFRLFTTSSTGFEYRAESYPRTGSGSSALPALGRIAGDIATVPFFAAQRGANGQPASDPLNRKTIEGSGGEKRRYFGCWLDINQTDPQFEEDGVQKSIQEILKGEHQCLVAEVDCALDPIPPGATPGTNENLAQRNLIINEAPNPASSGTRIIAHTLEIAPSKGPKLDRQAVFASPAALDRLPPDELVFTWGNVPRGSQVSIYLPDVEADEVMALVARRPGAATVAKVDAHTLRLTVGGITYLPVPGGRARTIPALLSIQLPPDLVKGTVYKATVKQFEGRRRRVLATVQLTIPITTSAEILPGEIRRLAVLRHIHAKMAQTNKWWPVFDRWLGIIADRVRGMGGNPDAVEPSSTGNQPGGGKDGGGAGGSDHDHPAQFTGKVAALHYDCFGDFTGFTMKSCARDYRFKACEPGIERVVQAACKDRSTLTVATDESGHGVRGIIVRCCAGHEDEEGAPAKKRAALEGQTRDRLPVPDATPVPPPPPPPAAQTPPPQDKPIREDPPPHSPTHAA